MANLDPAAALARLADGCARVRAAARPDDVLDVVAGEARVLAGAPHAWAARVEGGSIVSLRSTSETSATSAELAAPPLAAMLAEGRPLVRVEGFLGALLLGSGAGA